MKYHLRTLSASLLWLVLASPGQLFARFDTFEDFLMCYDPVFQEVLRLIETTRP